MAGWLGGGERTRGEDLVYPAQRRPRTTELSLSPFACTGGTVKKRGRRGTRRELQAVRSGGTPGICSALLWGWL